MNKQAKIREFFSKLEAAVGKKEPIPYELLIAGKPAAQRTYAELPPSTTDVVAIVPRQNNFGVGLPPLARC